MFHVEQNSWALQNVSREKILKTLQNVSREKNFRTLQNVSRETKVLSYWGVLDNFKLVVRIGHNYRYIITIGICSCADCQGFSVAIK